MTTATQTQNRTTNSFAGRPSSKSASPAAAAATKRPGRTFLDIILKALSAAHA